MSKNKVSEALKVVLADSYMLYLKTHNYHWNVEGKDFNNLHLLFMTQYTELALAIDNIAELIRGLGDKAPGSFEKFLKLTKLKSGNETITSDKMLKELSADQDVISESITKALSAAQAVGDEVVAGAMIERLTVHRKNKWMLNVSAK